MNERFVETLIEKYLDADLSADERGGLERELRDSPRAIALFWQLAERHTLLCEWGLARRGLGASVASGSQPARPASGWPRRWARVAALVGLPLVLGTVLGAGVAWTMTAAPVQRTLIGPANGDFEDLAAAPRLVDASRPLVESLDVTGVWAGDPVRIAGGEHGIQPAAGGRMLVFEQAQRAPGFERDRRAVACDLFQVVDLSAWHAWIARGDATLDLTAAFHDSGRHEEDVQFNARLFVYDRPAAEVLADWPMSRLDAVAMQSVGFTVPGGRPLADWQHPRVKCFVPPGATFALVHLSVIDSAGDPLEPRDFGGQYCDDVRLTLERPEQ